MTVFAGLLVLRFAPSGPRSRASKERTETPRNTGPSKIPFTLSALSKERQFNGRSVASTIEAVLYADSVHSVYRLKRASRAHSRSRDGGNLKCCCSSGCGSNTLTFFDPTHFILAM
jgi:hypothetical protein